MSPFKTLFSGGALLFASTSVFASAFQLLEQNASGLGNAYAGSAVVAEDASTVFFNPAGMAWLPQGKRLATVGGNLINPSAKFSNDGTVMPTFPLAKSYAAGGDGGDTGSLAAVPHAYLVWPVYDDMSIGVGIGAPFGLKTEYDNSWRGRFQGVVSDVKTINLNPSISLKIDEGMSVGFGVNYQRLQGEFTSAVYYPGAIYEKVNPLLGGLAAAGMGNLAPEGSAKITGSSNAWGYNLGVTLKVSEVMRVGASYRSAIKHHLKGTADFSKANNALLDSAAALQSPSSPARGGGVYSDIELPETVTFSGLVNLNEKWDVVGDISWTGWSKIPVLQFNYIDNSALVSKTTENWRNTWRIAGGGIYKYDDRTKLRFGLAFDQTPVPDSTRTVRLPDNDRVWLAVGGQYRLNQASVVDIGYAHLAVKNSTIDSTADDAVLYGRVKGSYKNSVDIFGAQFSTAF